MAVPVPNSSRPDSAAATAPRPMQSDPTAQDSLLPGSKSASTDNPQHPTTTITTTPVAGRSAQSMNAKKEIWKLEQHIIAALVRVDPDPPIDNSVIDGQNNPLFHVVRDDHLDVFSFSTSPELYGGVDVSFPTTTTTTTDENNTANDGEAVAVYVVIDRRTMKVVYLDHVFFSLEIPYVPGFLAFREIGPLELLVQRQIQNQPEMTPQAIFVDGNGIFHPRNAGIACFLGTRTDIPTIGIGKSLLYGCGWTRENVDEALDQFVIDVHNTIGQLENRHLALQLSRCRGLIMKKRAIASNNNSDDPAMTDDGDIIMTQESGSSPTSTNTSSSHRNGYDRKQALIDLTLFCNGLAIPLTVDGPDNDTKPKASTDDKSTSSRHSILGCALIGHGGQIAATARSKPQGGSVQPIFVSVGHKISLQEAVRLTASLSVARIPEPVRKADLFGRELMRLREAASRTPTSTIPTTTDSSSTSPS